MIKYGGVKMNLVELLKVTSSEEEAEPLSLLWTPKDRK
jgi:hypothetical protein